jgi:3-deoxy-D-manno-octulosonate 8-phosphate phosphatase (KDO 8-P phosphatase)
MTLHERCQPIELLVLDVDGVLTDGRIIYADNRVEIKSFHVRDGSGLKLWHQAGKASALITGRRSSVVEQRATELGIGTVIQGVADKWTAFTQLRTQLQLDLTQVAAMGDDLPDLPVLRRVGLALTVADGCAEVRAAAHWISPQPGGGGAVRAAIELILQAQQRWSALVAGYES